jgi:type II secretory pathway component PulF
MSSPPCEPRNPFYALLLVASVLFVVTALAWAVVPALEKKARAAGQPVPTLPLREVLENHGATCLLVEVAAMILFGGLSMGLDRVRRLQKERPAVTIPPAEE